MSSAPQANELADCLDQVLPPDSRVVPDHVAEGDPLVSVAVQLARGPYPTLDRSRVAEIQAQVLAKADSLPRPKIISHHQLVRVMRWAVVACLVVVLLAIGTVSASAQSLPGDTLYPVKRLVERGRLAVASGSDEVSLRLEFADRRLDEFEKLLKEQNKVHLDTLDDAVEEMTSTLDLIREDAAVHHDVLNRLVELSARQVELATQAQTEVEQDPSTVSKLTEVTAEAEQVGVEALDLAAPAGERSGAGVSGNPESAPAAQTVSNQTPEISDVPPQIVESAAQPNRIGGSETKLFFVPMESHDPAPEEETPDDTPESNADAPVGVPPAEVEFSDPVYTAAESDIVLEEQTAETGTRQPADDAPRAGDLQPDRSQPGEPPYNDLPVDLPPDSPSVGEPPSGRGAAEGDWQPPTEDPLPPDYGRSSADVDDPGIVSPPTVPPREESPPGPGVDTPSENTGQPVPPAQDQPAYGQTGRSSHPE